MAGFKDSFDPEKDLIYGIGAWISRYIIHYDSGGKKRYTAGQNIPQIEWDAAHVRKERDSYAINTFNTAITNATYAVQNSTLGVNGVSATDYMKAIEVTKYGTKGTVGDQSKLAPKLAKSNKNLDSGDPGSVCAAAKDLAIRRSSKFGIKYAVENLGGRVHYLVDDIKQEVLLEKSTIKNSSGYEKIPICTSEIRFLFRNWRRFSGKVVFWEGYETARAPWESTIGAYQVGWAKYALERMWKFKNKISGQHTEFAAMKEKDYKILITNVEKFVGGDSKKRQNGATIIKSRLGETIESPSEIIRAFHALPNGLVNEDNEPT